MRVSPIITMAGYAAMLLTLTMLNCSCSHNDEPDVPQNPDVPELPGYEPLDGLDPNVPLLNG